MNSNTKHDFYSHLQRSGSNSMNTDLNSHSIALGAAKDSLSFYTDMMEQKMNNVESTKILPKFSAGTKVIIGSHPNEAGVYRYSGRLAIITEATLGSRRDRSHYYYWLKPVKPGYFPDETLCVAECLLTAYTDNPPAKVTLADLLDVIHESVDLSSADELKRAVKLIIEVQAMDSGMRDCIRAAYLNGPIDDGDVPSKSGRDALLDSGYISKVVVKGEQGFNACTYKGSSAYKLIVAGA